MYVHVWPNSAPDAPRLKTGRLPVRQRLIWVGPWFILIQRKRGV